MTQVLPNNGTVLSKSKDHLAKIRAAMAEAGRVPFKPDANLSRQAHIYRTNLETMAKKATYQGETGVVQLRVKGLQSIGGFRWRASNLFCSIYAEPQEVTSDLMAFEIFMAAFMHAQHKLLETLSGMYLSPVPRETSYSVLDSHALEEAYRSISNAQTVYMPLLQRAASFETKSIAEVDSNVVDALRCLCLSLIEFEKFRIVDSKEIVFDVHEEEEREVNQKKAIIHIRNAQILAGECYEKLLSSPLAFNSPMAHYAFFLRRVMLGFFFRAAAMLFTTYGRVRASDIVTANASIQKRAEWIKMAIRATAISFRLGIESRGTQVDKHADKWLVMTGGSAEMMVNNLADQQWKDTMHAALTGLIGSLCPLDDSLLLGISDNATSLLMAPLALSIIKRVEQCVPFANKSIV